MATIKTENGTIIQVEGESRKFKHPEITDSDIMKNLIEMRERTIEEDPSWKTKWKHQ